MIQQTARPSKFPNFDRTGSQTPVQSQASQEDHTGLFAKLIARCAKDIDILIESLPNEDNSIDIQNQSLSMLEYENQTAARNLQDVVSEGEELLTKIQDALEDIALAQLTMNSTMKDEM